jgi:hypothetical protein
MEQNGSALLLWTVRLGLAAAAAGLTGLAFALWVDHGPLIFSALAQSGLSWCF